MKKSRALIIVLLAFFCVGNISVSGKGSFSDGGGILYTQPVKSVIFRHQYHVDVKKISCEKCHSGLFEMDALSAQEKKDFIMESFYRGRYCGACHNGKDAFAADTQCARCHIRISEDEVGHVKGRPRPYKTPVYNTAKVFGKDDMRVLFKHENHTPPLNCRECHLKYFQIKQGANVIGVADHEPGKFCFGCHDGRKTFSWYNCNTCHKNWKEIAQVGTLRPGVGRGTCYECHSNESKMKELVKPPEMHGEAEG
ncbi:MAG TPA: cytochrome c3 family protein [Smithellaceae bacterium]|nr:cytochrome c3 family protein [Smithellaceae bacterium]HRS88428.1 cytochrome c3 family protein [Smithellaceae bacterium]HRV25484.1 cytochrome c3 family protein [Smithellaceae bacterium]